MSQMPPEEQVKLEHHLRETAKILYKYTNSDKLKDFESIETEVREQMMERVGPFIGDFFFSEGRRKRETRTRKVKSIIGEVEIGRKQGRKLGLEAKTAISPGLSLFCQSPRIKIKRNLTIVG